MKRFLRPIAIAFTAVVLLWSVNAVLFYLIRTPDERASIGEMFGAVNALFSGLAFVGVIGAILLQSEELSLQRDELKLTRTELAASAKAQRESAQSLEQQARFQLRLAQLNALTAQLQSCMSQINQEYQRFEAHRQISTAARPPDVGSLIAKRAGIDARIDAVLANVDAELSNQA
jgi:hypothetical protein